MVPWGEGAKQPVIAHSVFQRPPGMLLLTVAVSASGSFLESGGSPERLPGLDPKSPERKAFVFSGMVIPYHHSEQLLPCHLGFGRTH